MWTVQTLVANNTVPIARTTQRTTVQDTAKSAAQQNLSCKRLASYKPRPGRRSALSYSSIVSPTHVVPVILLRWVSKGSQHTHTSLYHFVTRARPPLQELSLQMASCWEAKYEGAEKASSADYLAALSNAQRNATLRMPCKTGNFFSIFFLVRELERRKNNNN